MAFIVYVKVAEIRKDDEKCQQQKIQINITVKDAGRP